MIPAPVLYLIAVAAVLTGFAFGMCSVLGPQTPARGRGAAAPERLPRAGYLILKDPGTEPYQPPGLPPEAIWDTQPLAALPPGLPRRHRTGAVVHDPPTEVLHVRMNVPIDPARWLP